VATTPDAEEKGERVDGLIDYTKEKRFWDLIESEAPGATTTFEHLWELSESIRLSKEDACSCLNALFLDSHARILKTLGKTAKVSYPTTKCNPNRLLTKPALWWVDHFTAGISHGATMNWFGSSSKGKASTHFVVGYHTRPFYIVPLMHGAWHTPARNADSWSIEMVNAGPVRSVGEDWVMWNGRNLPAKLVRELPPQPVSPAYKGAKFFQPFTADQVTTNIKLKRIIRWATEDKLLSPERMSQHSQWQEGKSDMGPMWPFEDVNTAVFEDYPLDELGAYQLALEAVYLPSNDFVCSEEFDDQDTCVENPEYGLETEPDKEAETTTLPPIKDIQQLLVNRGYSLTVDGIYGAKTKEAVTSFQRRCNDNSPGSLVVDGIVGPKTLEKLKR
jgi:N-acetyl-anhydromuramyl-L-alanine amidase AmpD